jgi:hypothetical protein
MKMRSKFTLYTIATIATLATLAGCQNKPSAPKVHLLKGRVTKIDTTSGVVTGMFWNKQNKEMELSGKLAPDAEIIIDGRTASLGNVEIGDDVEVEGFEDKQGESSNLIAKKVTIRRSATGATQPATATTQPAENKAKP